MGRPVGVGAPVGGRLRRVGASGITDRKARPAARADVVGEHADGPTSAGFAWIGEGVPKVVNAGGFGTLVLQPAKTAGIIAVTDELLRMSPPGTDVALRDVLVKGAQSFVDSEFTDQTIASNATRPGGLANGSPTAAASGTTAAAAATDVKAMINAFVAVNPNLEDARIVMSPNVAVALAVATNSTTLLATGGSLFGIPVATTAAIGNKILLFDASQVVYGDDPAGVRIDVSRQATLQLDSTPSDPTTAADIFQSAWQRDLIAFKAEYPIRWKLARTNAARTIAGVAYA
jgi:HK97 family phage major capsid protein